MQVITKNPILINQPWEDYLALDGSSSKEEILKFQKWANSKGEKLLNETGVFDAKTSDFYTKYKDRYEREMQDTIKLAPKGIKTIENNAIDSAYVPYFSLDNKTKKSWWQKKSKSQKNTIIIGSIAVATLIGYLLYKRKI